MFFLLVFYAAFGASPATTVFVHTENPLTTLEACTNLAEEMAVDSMKRVPELAPYKFYTCQIESI